MQVRESGLSDRARNGVVTVMVLVVLVLLGGILTQLVRRSLTEHRQSRRELHRRQTVLLADAGLQRARARWRIDSEYTGEVWEPDMKTIHPTNVANVEISRQDEEWLVVATYPENQEFPVRISLQKGLAQ